MGAAFLAIFITLVVYAVDFNNTNEHIHQLDLKMKKENSKLTSNGIYTVSANSEHYNKLEYRASLCHVEMYQVSEDDSGEVMENPTLVERSHRHYYYKLPPINQPSSAPTGAPTRSIVNRRGGGGGSTNPPPAPVLRGGGRGGKSGGRTVEYDDGEEDSEKDTYSVNLALDLRYNVGSEKLMRDEGEVKKNERFFIARYELTSNFPEFSTIRLVESSHDIYERRNKINRDIILCSDNGRAVDHCSRHTNADGIITLNRTQLFQMSSNRRVVLGNKASPSETQAPPPTQESIPEEVGEEEEKEEEEEEEYVVDDVVTNLQFYELYLYRKTDGGNKASDEYVALVITPTRCTNHLEQTF